MVLNPFKRPGRGKWLRPILRSCLLELETLEDRMLLATNVLTYHYDSASTGQNPNETILTRANVHSSTFGKLYQVQVDGQVFSQPLVDTGVTISTGAHLGIHDVVFVATEHDSIYAIDANDPGPTGTGVILWQRSFLTLDANDALPGATSISTVPVSDIKTSDVSVEIGITGTPVIDPATDTLYVIPKTKETVSGTAHYVQRIHAININDGTDRVTPFIIGDTSGNYTNNTPLFVNGTGDGTDGHGHVYFNALRQFQRGALTLVNSVVYAPWASHGDNGPYHGWVVGFDPTTLNLKAVFNTTPNAGLGGVWQAGGALSTDGQGNLYFETGNGGFDGNNGNAGRTPQPGAVTGLDANGFPIRGDYADSILKVTADPTSTASNQNLNGWGLKVVDYFTPFDQEYLAEHDLDLGSGANLILPDSVGSTARPHLLVGAGKEGNIYLVDRDNMGKYGTVDNVVQTIGMGLSGSLDTAAYYNGTIFYVEGYGGNAKTFSIANGVMSSSPISRSPDTFTFAGSTPSISANGSSNGIVWDIDRGTSQLRAYSTDSYATELYNSDQAAGNRDALGAAIKFQVPTVVNGHVYVGSGTGNPNNFLVVYGLVQPPNSAPNAPTSLTAAAVSKSQINLSWSDNDVIPNRADGYAIEQSFDGINFNLSATSGTGTSAYSVGGLNPLTTYYFRVHAFNILGSSASTNIAAAATTNQAGGINFGNGFSGAPSQLTFNGYGAANTLNGNNLVLTDGKGGEARSVFSKSFIDVTQFSNQFTFQLTNPQADGFTFTIQNSGPNALGSLGGGLGYGTEGGTSGSTIGKSLAIKFDLYNNRGEGTNSTGLYQNGASPTTPATDLTGTIDLHSGDLMRVAMTYDGTTLQVSITDTVTQKTATQSYAVNIPVLVGGNTALVGFTAGTGGFTAKQEVVSWVYTSTSTQPPDIPQNVATVITGYTAGSTTAVPLGAQVTWNPVQGATGYKVERKLGSTGTYLQIGTTLGFAVTTFSDTGLATQATYFYRVRATNGAGDGAYSSEVPLLTPALAPTPSNATATFVGPTQVTFSWTDNANNEDGFQIFRQTNTGGFSLLTSLPANFNPAPSTVVYTDSGLTPGNHYDYHVQAFNKAGYSDFAGVSVTTLNPSLGGLDYSGGFAGATGLTLNGTAIINGTKLQLTNGGPQEAASVFSTSQVDVTRFNTQFQFQLLNPLADGFTFTIQGNSATTLGPAGGGLGFGPDQTGGTGGIPNSVAVKFDLYNNGGEGQNSTGLFINGAAPTAAGSIDLTAAGIDLHTGHLINAALVYDGTTLDVILTDTATNVSAIQTYTINIPIFVGGGTAYVGFTAGTGGLTATQIILGWAYTPASAPAATPNAPSTLLAVQTTSTEVDLAWQDNSNTEDGYKIFRQTGSTGPFVLIATLLPNIVGYKDASLTPNTQYNYQVEAFNSTGTSNFANLSVTTLPSQSTGLNFSNGFAAATGLSFNGSTAVNGSSLQLTNGGGHEAGSAFSSSALTISKFSTQFSFQLVNPSADGFTFTIQGQGPSAIGPAGGGLGYGPDHAGGSGGISNSVAVKFDLYNNEGEGVDSTGLYSNGVAPTVSGSSDLASHLIDLHSGHIFDVGMTYDGSNLQVTITDQTTLAAATQVYAVNIPALVGGTSAFVGFTGGTGGLTATQNILTWTFTPM